jgi:hypothetical protein
MLFVLAIRQSDSAPTWEKPTVIRPPALAAPPRSPSSLPPPAQETAESKTKQLITMADTFFIKTTPPDRHRFRIHSRRNGRGARRPARTHPAVLTEAGINYFTPYLPRQLFRDYITAKKYLQLFFEKTARHPENKRV